MGRRYILMTLFFLLVLLRRMVSESGKTNAKALREFRKV